MFRGGGRGRGGGGRITNRAFYQAVEQTAIQPYFQGRRKNPFGRRGGGDRRGPGGRPLGPGVTVVRRAPRGSMLVDGPRQGGGGGLVNRTAAGRKVNRKGTIQKRVLVPNTRFINTSLARRGGEFANTGGVASRRQQQQAAATRISARDSELLKKIKIVAELDRVPPPLSAQQSARVTRTRGLGGAANNPPVKMMTLNERFGR